MKITFFGATQVVTGSKYLVEDGDTKILVDCGLLQGTYDLTKHNLDPFPINPRDIDALVITHAHIDHTGYIPALVKQGFKGNIYCSSATYELCKILLLDSGSLQESDAERENSYHKDDPSYHKIEPLYTEHDAENSLHFFHPVEYDTPFTIKSLQITLIRSGHILGSAFIIVDNGKEKLTFSGDLGRPDQLLLKAPPYLKETDYLVLESTYGDRIHEKDEPKEELGAAINATVKAGGLVIIPSFTVMRAQIILYFLHQLKKSKVIPDVPVYLDSPEAIKVTNLFCTFKDEVTLSEDECKGISDVAIFTPDPEDSKKLDHLQRAAVIVAGSGMATGGRVIYHLQHYISDPKNTVLFVGYQAWGTIGRALTDGLKEVKIHGQSYPVHAKIKMIGGLSAHADQKQILEWLSHFQKAPKKVFLTHGEAESAATLQKEIEKRFHWSVVVPKYADSFDI